MGIASPFFMVKSFGPRKSHGLRVRTGGQDLVVTTQKKLDHWGQTL
jgi:hypothetical protein